MNGKWQAVRRCRRAQASVSPTYGTPNTPGPRIGFFGQELAAFGSPAFLLRRPELAFLWFGRLIPATPRSATWTSGILRQFHAGMDRKDRLTRALRCSPSGNICPARLEKSVGECNSFRSLRVNVMAGAEGFIGPRYRPPLTIFNRASRELKVRFTVRVAS